MDAERLWTISDLVANRHYAARWHRAACSPIGPQTGYVLAKDAWGKGYATEALRAVILIAKPIGIGHLFALCHADHRASAHVLEKCHFTFDRLIPHQTFPNLTPPRGSARHYTLNLVQV